MTHPEATTATATPTATVLVVDDEADLRENLCRFLERKGFAAVGAGTREEALAALAARRFDLALVDVRLPDGSGLTLLDHVRTALPGTRVVVMTAFASVDDAVKALRSGASDYLLKPMDLDLVATKVAMLVEQPAPAAVTEAWPNLVAQSDAMKRVTRLAAHVAPSPATVLLTGESGAGKEVLARAIHDASPRRAEPFVAVNCGALPDSLVESELFGHEKGAFSGAAASKRGLFEVAEGGTIFLDEVGELPLAAQVKLLRAIERKEVRRVGATAARTLDLRVLAATNRDLKTLVAAGTFRRDLYYRLAVFELNVPPLRDRRADVAPLAKAFLARSAAEVGRTIEGFTAEAIARLESYSWPGNVRELENVVARAALLAAGSQVLATDIDLPEEEAGASSEGGPPDDLRKARTAFERAHVLRVLRKHGDDKQKAADALGIDLSSLYRKIAKQDTD